MEFPTAEWSNSELAPERCRSESDVGECMASGSTDVWDLMDSVYDILRGGQ